MKFKAVVYLVCFIVVSTTSAQVFTDVFSTALGVGQKVIKPAFGIAELGVRQKEKNPSIDLLPVIGIHAILGVKQKVGDTLTCVCPAGDDGKMVRYLLVSAVSSVADGKQKIIGDDVICACPTKDVKENVQNPTVSLDSFETGPTKDPEVGKLVGGLLHIAGYVIAVVKFMDLAGYFDFVNP